MTNYLSNGPGLCFPRHDVLWVGELVNRSGQSVLARLNQVHVDLNVDLFWTDVLLWYFYSYMAI